MLKIAHCESGMRQFYKDSNEVVKSPTNDFGLLQINAKWIPKAEELGYDIMSVEGNIKMAKYIKEVQGLKAWSCYKIVSRV